MHADHPEGTRHDALLKIGMSLVGNGMSPQAVFAELRTRFDPEKTDKEIRDVIDWCIAKNPTPSVPMNGHKVNGNGTNGHTPPRWAAAEAKTPEPVLTPAENVARIVGVDLGEFDENYWREKSSVSLADDFRQDAALLLSVLYQPEDGVNILTLFTVNEKGKANPQGSGKTMLRDKWLKWFSEKGVPNSEAGAWIRPNPCNQVGSGKDGAICDADISACRFLMIESDSLSIASQLALYAKLPLPVVAIILSGGDSAHAWLKVDCKDREAYTALVTEFYTVATTLGFDRANKNASRLSRLPGAQRKIGATGDGQQRLIYLNPTPTPYSFAKFKAKAVPTKGLIGIGSLTARVRAHMQPKGQAFTLTFLRGKNADEGFYFRPGEVTIWSGMSSHGKSTMLATVMLQLMTVATPFFVCSLEYKPEKLCEMLAAITMGRPPTENECVEFVETAARFISFADVVGNIEPARLLELMRASHAENDATHFIIDSLMRVSGLEENYPEQGDFLCALQAIAKETNGHIHLVAHPRKIDEASRARKMDIKGSSALANNADNVVTMKRNMDKKALLENDELTPELDEAMHDAEFAVEKQRETGWEGVVKLKFNRYTKIFEAYVPPKTPIQFPKRKR